jgi:hypothetical protein
MVLFTSGRKENGKMAANKTWEVVDEDHLRSEGASRHNTRQSLRWLAELLDSRYTFLGIRFGWDPIVGLIPGFGDILTSFAGFYILIQASNLGAPPSIILRMGLNLVIDNLFDAVPILGHIFDVFWRANLMNVALLDRYLENPRRTVARSRAVVIFTLLGVIIVSLLCAAFAAYLAIMLIQWILRFSGTWV